MRFGGAPSGPKTFSAAASANANTRGVSRENSISAPASLTGASL